MREFLPQLDRFLLLLFACSLFVPTSVQSQTNPVQTCTLTAYMPNDHAIWLYSIPGDPSTDYVFAPSGGLLELFADSSVRISGRIYNIQDSTRQWDLVFWLVNPLNYTDWTNLGRSFKNGGGADSMDILSWVFYEMDNTRSILRGVPGSPFDGDSLNIFHRPADLAFGFQWGTGANDKNGNFGISGWFNFLGSYEGKGDLNANMACDSLPPPVNCSVEIDSFYAECKSDSSFEVIIDFQGVGNNFVLSDNLGDTLLSGISPGTYRVGDYFNSTDIQLTIADPDFQTCQASTFPVTLDCTPVATCDLVVDTLYTQCVDDSTFAVTVQISGTSQFYVISDNQGTPPLDSLSGGTYTFGNYPEDSLVSLMVSDWAVFNCFEIFDSLTHTCPDSSSAGLLSTLSPYEVEISPVFPNPVSHQTRIHVYSRETETLPFSVRIVDGMGRMRQETRFVIQEGHNEFDLTVDQPEPGLYFMGFGIQGQVISAQRLLIVE